MRPLTLRRASLVSALSRMFSHVDWVLLVSAVAISCAGLVTMFSFGPDNSFFERQIIWLALGLLVFFLASSLDYRFLRRTWPVAVLFLFAALSLVLVLIFGEVTKGAQSRFVLGAFVVQPTEPAKLILIALLAKYFARRHIEIAHIRHILVPGAYAGILAGLVFLQPDFGSAIIIALIWFGMVLVAGISRKHLVAVLLTGALLGAGMWGFVLQDYQKARVMTFLHPLADIQGAGYNAYQSTIAVGSGQVFGKGIGFGTQSELQFLPEYETDFIFAAFAEEWGFIGVILLFGLFGIVVWRVISYALQGASNFETLFAVGFAIFLISHFVLHVGINVGLLPVTGTTIPFMSYGGSHLITEFLGLGVLMGMRRYARVAYPENTEKEFIAI